MIRLGWPLALLCLCVMSMCIVKHSEVMSEADTQTLQWQAEIMQLYVDCLHFLCTRGGQPFVNTSAGKGWVEVCMCIDRVQKLILACYVNPVAAKEQYVVLIVVVQTYHPQYYSNVKHRHVALLV